MPLFLLRWCIHLISFDSNMQIQKTRKRVLSMQKHLFPVFWWIRWTVRAGWAIPLTAQLKVVFFLFLIHYKQAQCSEFDWCNPHSVASSLMLPGSHHLTTLHFKSIEESFAAKKPAVKLLLYWWVEWLQSAGAILIKAVTRRVHLPPWRSLE